ncbi:hypothetical protein Bca4012_026834 [Brassica carinata]
MINTVAAFRPVNFGLETVEKPKKKKGKVSNESSKYSRDAEERDNKWGRLGVYRHWFQVGLRWSLLQCLMKLLTLSSPLERK